MKTTDIDTLIANKSREQAEQEWREFLEQTYKFLKEKNCSGDEGSPFELRYSALGIRKYGVDHMSGENQKRFKLFEDALSSFAVGWRQERSLRLINDKTKELIEKLSLLPL